MAVHLYGRAAPIENLAKLGLPVVEDAAQAHGLRLGSRRAGSAGLLGCFSFYPTKNLGAFGDGGAVTTSDAELAARVRELRAYGERPRHFARLAGANSRLDELQAALLRVRLRRLDDDNRRRAEIAARYDDALGRTSPRGVHHLYVVRSPRRDEFRAHLAEFGIETAIHYPWTIGEQPAFATACRHGELEVSTRAAREVASLPCYAHLSSDEEAVVAEQLSALAVGRG
jgi:dTDP-4-amino-4,6-dideoxygalactose transaminase